MADDYSSDRESDFSSSSSESSESSSDEIDLAQIQPYSFEPRYERDELDEEMRRDEVAAARPSRVNNLDWCSCGKCRIMEREKECLCCNECVKTLVRLQQIPPAQQAQLECITDHRGFKSVCLDPWVLEVAWMAYKQWCTNAYDGPNHKKFRP